jgi:hypothetical protein
MMADGGRSVGGLEFMRAAKKVCGEDGARVTCEGFGGLAVQGTVRERGGRESAFHRKQLIFLFSSHLCFFL